MAAFSMHNTNQSQNEHPRQPGPLSAWLSTIALLVHPLLLTSYSVLFIYSVNLRFLRLESIIRTAIVVHLATIVLTIAISLLVRDAAQGTFLVSVFLILFLSYGSVLIVVKTLILDVDFATGHGLLLPVWFVLLAMGVLVGWRKKTSLDRLNRYLTTVSIALLAIALFNVVRYELARRPIFDPAWRTLDSQAIHASLPEQPPDVWYIILDEYSGNSVLRERHAFDNSPFTDSLRKRGFFVPTDSCSNYSHSNVSLASSLNMQYLDKLGEDVGSDSFDRTPTFRFIRDNTVSQILGNVGYEYVHLSTGWGPTERNRWADEDIRLRNRLTQFELVYGSSTWLNPVLEPVVTRDQRARIYDSFEILAALAQHDERPRFIFAHFLLPHQPHFFTPQDAPPPEDGLSVDGVILDQDTFAEFSGYLNQVSFANRMVVRLVDQIMSTSEVPPIIVIQGDHGDRNDLDSSWGAQEYHQWVHPILNAYYLPDGGDEMLYASITPVNTFRVILDTYFGTELGLLEDKSFFSPVVTQYGFVELPPGCGPGQ